MAQDRQPIADLPRPLEGYGLPEKKDHLLGWGFVTQRMESAQVFWVCTIAENGCPHARPIWGVWLDTTLFFGGGPGTRWFRNLQNNPKVAIHSENGTEAIIFEGFATLVENESMMGIIDDAYERKYGIRHGPPIWQLHPERVFAWDSMQTMTKFTFE